MVIIDRHKAFFKILLKSNVDFIQIQKDLAGEDNVRCQNN